MNYTKKTGSLLYFFRVFCYLIIHEMRFAEYFEIDGDLDDFPMA